MSTTVEERLDDLVVRLNRLMDEAEAKVAALEEHNIDPTIVSDVRDGFARIGRPGLDSLDEHLDTLTNNLNRLDESLSAAEDALEVKLSAVKRRDG